MMEKKVNDHKILIAFLVLLVFVFAGFSFTYTYHARNVQKPLKATPIQFFNLQTELSWDEVLSPQIDDWFKRLCSGSRFNGNILVAKSGRIIYRNSYGYANYERKDTLTIRHRFQTGSISKTFTAVAVLVLKENASLNLDDPVEKFIPGFPYQGITIRMLLSHRSGLPNYNYFCDLYTDRETIIYNEDVERLMIDSVPAFYFPPDVRFDYCNTNFVLLARIIEKISGMSYEEFMRKEIFHKAGMRNTSIFVNGRRDRLMKAATGYLFPWTVAQHTYQDGVTGDKGLYSTVDDLWLWNIALDRNLLVKPETLAEAFVPAQPEMNGHKNYGLGWRLTTAIDSSKFIFHTGWWRGFNGMFVKDIKNDAVYIILSNVRNRAMYAMFPELLGIIDPPRRQMQIKADSLMQQLQNAKDSVNQDLQF